MLDLKSLITLVHLSGLSLGLGGAWIIDAFLMKHLVNERITEENYAFIHFASKFVCIGLALLWVSGGAFILHYYFFSPELLLNEKVWAKVCIVSVLSINGVLVHSYVLPKIRTCIGSPILMMLPDKTAYIMTVVGTISCISWVFPVILGVAKSLNFVVPASTILSVYVFLIAICLVLSQLILISVMNKAEPVTLEERVVFLRKTYYFDVPEISAFIQHKYKIKVSEKTINAVLTKRGLQNLPRERRLSVVSS